MKRIIILLIFLTGGILSITAQELNNQKIEKIRSLEIDVQKLNLLDVGIQKEMHQILHFERKRKGNKTMAIVFTSISALSLILGASISASNSKSNSFVGDVFGDLAIGAGFVYGGLSVPFWVLSNKRKKQRDQLIENYK